MLMRIGIPLMLLSLVGCSSGSRIIGKWKASGSILETTGAVLADADDTTYEFRSDGTYHMDFYYNGKLTTKSDGVYEFDGKTLTRKTSSFKSDGVYEFDGKTLTRKTSSFQSLSRNTGLWTSRDAKGVPPAVGTVTFSGNTMTIRERYLSEREQYSLDSWTRVQD